MQMGSFRKEMLSLTEAEEGSGQASKAMLSIALAIRTNDFSFYRERLEFRDNCDLESIDTVLVDDGSPQDVSKEIESFCGERGWKYVYLDTGDQEFSLARARNAGILAAQTEWVFTDDADIIYEQKFFQRIVNEVSYLDETPFTFLTIPAIYLSQEASDAICATGEIESHAARILSRMLLENPRGDDVNKTVQSFSPASALLAFRKKTALLVGGYDTAFTGWGGEDRDFVFRLLLQNISLKLPEDFEITKDWNFSDTHHYEGWRSLYRLIGEYMAKKGIYAYHLYHEPNKWRSRSQSISNRNLASENAVYYLKKRKVPCLPHDSAPRDVIIGFNPYIANMRVRETLHNPVIVDDPTTLSPKEYVSEILEFPVNSVLMWNPYGNEWRLDVYNEFKSRGITPIVGERGALPGTIYFDKGGLCIESDSYREEIWARNLTEQEAVVADAHIARVRYGIQALEKQSDRLGAWKIRKQLGISDTTKILLAPLQLYDDTVTMFFSEEGRTYKDYIDMLNRLSVSLPKDWVLLYKDHPLSLKKTPLQGGICADAYHINDLLEASDIISVFNSGVGLLAQAFEKYVLCYGRCFYAIDGVNCRLDSIDSTLKLLNEVPKPDMAKVRQFFYYLNEDFYSFADMEAGVKPGTKLSKRADLKKVTYRTIRIPGFQESDFSTEIFDLYSTPLFDIYRHAAMTGKVRANDTRRISRVGARRPFQLTSAKWRKLRRNPHAFFEDANLDVLRPMRHLFRNPG